MAKENNKTATSSLTYDQAMARVEAIVQQLEQSEAISLNEYKQLADEARQLLAFCRNEVEKISKEFTDTH
ncbi:MAG: exodeoxyribonuclease VII small subunit [Paludibacteraceae bacterium]|nr:exodeoxyribonuclease VII small subunit [Paludibacteraceae bacterium]